MKVSKKDLKMIQMQDREAFQRLMKDYLNDPHHRIPQSRRDFLSSGAMLFAGSTLLPTLSQLIASSAWAAECDGAASTASLPAYINIQLSGGAALFANYLVRGTAGSSLSYDKLGMGAAPRAENLFANQAPFWVEIDDVLPASGMIRGLFSSLPKTDAIYAKTAFIAVAAESLDDRSTNKNDLSGMLAAAGFAGSNLPHLYTGYGGSLNEGDGIPNNLFVGAILNSATMLNVKTADGLQSSLSFKGALATVPNPVNVIKAIEDLSKYQVETLTANPNSSESKKIFSELIQCSTHKNTTVMAEGSNANFYGTADFPNKTTVASTWALNKASTHTNSELIGKGLTVERMNAVIQRSGLIVANCLRGFSAAATINLGGYDYHFSQYTRQSADLKDRFFGDILGRILKTAQIFNRKVFIHVSSDGSVGSPNSSSATANWSGENQKHGMNYIIAYDPVAAPVTAGYSQGDYTDMPYQLNHFTSAGNVNNANPIGSADAQDLCASAVFLNFLNFAGKASLIDSAALSSVKARLVSSLPSGTNNIFDYYTRLKPRG